MSPSSALRSPFVRVPFLAFAVVATVATSQAKWDVDALAVDEGLTLAPGTSVARKIEFEGSHEVVFDTVVSGSAAPGTKVHVEHADASGEPDADAGATGDAGSMTCRGGWIHRADDERRWVRVDRDGVPYESSPQSTMTLRGECSAKSGVTLVKITNESTAELELHLTVRAVISGVGDSDAPDGAFVRAKVVP
ncbi:MAG: hypothetical protein KF764_20710 [Labilithrix sp.]|nr:hypothetical protein [Labilithrix sp.]